MRHEIMRRVAAWTLAIAACSTFVSITVADDADTDGDGLVDAIEDRNGNGIVDEGETSFLNADTDGGGESDASEVRAGRNPLDPADDLTFDADNDGWVNGIELLHRTDPRNPDTDGDGVNDPLDPFPLDATASKDDNKNGLPDEWEKATGLSNQSTERGANDDADGDGLTNADELTQNTNPLSVDTDHDGVTDHEELIDGTNPRENACLQFGEKEEPFADIADHWAAPWVAVLQRTSTASGSNAIVSGYASGSSTLFLPEQRVTRFEFLKMVLLSTCIPLKDDSYNAQKRFDDVPIVAQLHEDSARALRRQVVYTAVREHIVEGYPDSTFRPDAPVSRSEALAMLLRAASLGAPQESTNRSLEFIDVPKDAWYQPFVSTALWYDIITGYSDHTFRPTNPITRAEAAAIIVRTMRVNPWINGYAIEVDDK
jgi:hypothetical protein